jgi:predicted O-linked N-acetylglucosamine transferase (SPINDLY family)
MTKDQLQQELLKKLKLGIKPSDLKKPRVKNSFDEGYESETDSHKSLVKNTEESKIKQLQSQVKFEANKAQAYLTELQSQPIQLSKETEQAIVEANQKIRELIKTNEDLQSKNNTLSKTITELKKPVKTSEETNLTTFTCSSCVREFNLDLIRLAKKSGKKVCRNCTLAMLKRANQLTGKHMVLKIKKQPEANPPPKTFLCQTCQQSTHGEPHQVHLTNYQEQGINPRQLTSICSPCLQDKVVLANFYCPRTSEGKDTWDPKEAQFDCWCPVERSNL